jgi:ubiquinone biosynthesis protein
MITSLLKGDAEELVKGVESIGATSPDTDHDKILEGAEKLLGKYSDVTSVNDLDVMVLFNEVTDLAKENNVELPGRFTMLGRSVITIEGVIEDICPELNLLELLTAKISDRIKKSFDLKKTAIDFGKGVLDVGSKTVKIPAQISDMLGNINRGKLKVNMEVTGLDEPLDRIGEFLRYSLLLIVACVVFLGSCVLCLAKIEPMAAGNVPILALAGILFSIALGIFSVKKLWKK